MPNRSKNKKYNPVEKPLVPSSGDGQLYGIVERVLGGCYYNVKCYDDKMRRCKLRKGRRRHLKKIDTGDIVLISLRDFDDNNGDLLEKYNRDHIRQLIKMGEIPESSTQSLYLAKEDNDDVFVFEDI